MTTMTSVTLPRKILEKIDPLIERDGYSSRASFVRQAIMQKLKDIERQERKHD